MADTPLLLLSLCLIYFIFFSFPFIAFATSSCNGRCRTLDDCDGQLICIGGKCNDDPNVGATHICDAVNVPSPPPPPPYFYRSPPPPHHSGQAFPSPPPPPPYFHRSPPPPHPSGQTFRSPPPPPPHHSGRGEGVSSSLPPPPPPPPPPPLQPFADECQPSGTLFCRGQYYSTYNCSPQITPSTPAILTANDFSDSGNGGGPSACDGKYHNNSDFIVSLSTGWYNGGLLCGKMIKIMAYNGRSVLVMVVGECDSLRGCDGEHSSGQPPCGYNIINGSDAVWTALGLDKESGDQALVTWTKVIDVVGCDSNNYIVHIM